MENVVIVAILALLVIGIVRYLIKAKKRGETCIGCPYAKQCDGHCNGSCKNEQTDSKQNPES